MRGASVLAVVFVLVACGSGGQTGADGERAADVRLAAQHLRDDHPNLFHDLSPSTFAGAVEELAARADSLGDDELLVGLMRLAALPGVRDGHTGIFPLDPSNGHVLHMYPIRLYTFSDGTYVVGQAGGSDLLRARLLAVNGRSLGEVVILRVAGIYWQKSTADDPRVAIEPHVPVDLSSSDFFAGRDPVLAAALAAAVAPRRLAAAPRPRFSYDRNRPLNLRLGEVQENNGVVRQALTFDAGFGQKAAYWTHPRGTGPWPVVLFSPGSDGDATTQLPDAEGLARRGIASLTVTPPRLLVSCRAAADVRAYSNYVVGRRRALDLMAELPGADSARVAAVGFSFGAAVSGTLAGLDHRLRGAVIQSGRAHLSAALRTFCRRLGTKRLKSYIRAYSVVDPVRYVSRAAPATLLFQNGTRDPISPRADVEAFVRAASAPKELRWYEAGHVLGEQARMDRDAWLRELLRP